MLCPACSRQLQKISVTTNQGDRFDVDHCGYCGGTWFDPYEINRIPFHEVVTLANLTVAKDRKFSRPRQHICPNDHRPLDPFMATAIPSGVRLLWCKKCLGIWATQKALWEFKKHQEDSGSAYDLGAKFFPKLSVAFIPVMTFLFLLATTFTTIFSVINEKESRIFAESRISNLNVEQIQSSAVSLSFITRSTYISSVTYGQSSLEMKTLAITSVPSQSHNIIITGLTPNTLYLYRLHLTDSSGNNFTTSLKFFSTP